MTAPMREGIYSIRFENLGHLNADGDNAVVGRDDTKWRIQRSRTPDAPNRDVYTITLDRKIFPESYLTLNTSPGPNQNNIRISVSEFPFESQLWTFEDVFGGLPPASIGRIQSAHSPGLAAGIGPNLPLPINVIGVESKPGAENQIWAFTYLGSE